LTKAKLIELDVSFKPDPAGKQVTVQFNPETLKVSYSNQVASASGRKEEGDKSGSSVDGTRTAKLAVQLWFDVTGQLPQDQAGTNDVRKLTKEIIHFMMPRERGQNDPPTSPPAVRFQWGSFQFDGLMDSLEESLEFFSSDGRPLRASVSLGVSQPQTQKLAIGAGGPLGAFGLGAGAGLGTSPLATAVAGATLQGIAAASGGGREWQQIAAANGIENPRLLAPGQLIDLRARAR
jgi:hypothetical protein